MHLAQLPGESYHRRFPNPFCTLFTTTMLHDAELAEKTPSFVLVKGPLWPKKTCQYGRNSSTKSGCCSANVAVALWDCAAHWPTRFKRTGNKTNDAHPLLDTETLRVFYQWQVFELPTVNQQSAVLNRTMQLYPDPAGGGDCRISQHQFKNSQTYELLNKNTISWKHDPCVQQVSKHQMTANVAFQSAIPSWV